MKLQIRLAKEFEILARFRLLLMMFVQGSRRCMEQTTLVDHISLASAYMLSVRLYGGLRSYQESVNLNI